MSMVTTYIKGLKFMNSEAHRIITVTSILFTLAVLLNQYETPARKRRHFHHGIRRGACV